MVRSTSQSEISGGEGDGESQQREAEDYIPSSDAEELTKAFAKCKWFNVAKGFGFVTLENLPQKTPEKGKSYPDIFVYQSTIKMQGFRSLREGESVEVSYKKSDKGLEAVSVTGPGGKDCLGSEKRPKRRKKGSDRCYNCDVCGHHAKECTHPPLPKKCHHCKSVHHLVAACPTKRDRTGSQQQQAHSSMDDEQNHNGDGENASQQRHHNGQQDHQQEPKQEMLPQGTNHLTSQPQDTSTSQTPTRYS